MPISIAARPSNGAEGPWVRPSDTLSAPAPWRGCAGFTLLEISLVIIIISLMLGLVLPVFRNPGRSELLAQSHRLQLTFRYLRSEAILNGYGYRLNYDLDQQRYWVTPDQSADLAEFARDTGPLARGTRLKDLANPIEITDIILPTVAGKIAQGQIYTVFYPDGSVDPTVIHLASSNEAYTLWVNPMNYKLNADPGYREIEYGG